MQSLHVPEVTGARDAQQRHRQGDKDGDRFPAETKLFLFAYRDVLGVMTDWAAARESVCLMGGRRDGGEDRLETVVEGRIFSFSPSLYVQNSMEGKTCTEKKRATSPELIYTVNVMNFRYF